MSAWAIQVTFFFFDAFLTCSSISWNPNLQLMSISRHTVFLWHVTHCEQNKKEKQKIAWVLQKRYGIRIAFCAGIHHKNCRNHYSSIHFILSKNIISCVAERECRMVLSYWARHNGFWPLFDDLVHFIINIEWNVLTEKTLHCIFISICVVAGFCHFHFAQRQYISNNLVFFVTMCVNVFFFLFSSSCVSA